MKTTLKILGVIVFIAVASITIGFWGARDKAVLWSLNRQLRYMWWWPRPPVSKPAPTAQQGIKLETHIDKVQFDNSK